jgi:hypothetical protein
MLHESPTAPSAIEKTRLIASILELNPGAEVHWLERFEEKALRRYLDHLHYASEPRGRGSAWIRDGETPAVVGRQPAA